MQYPLNGIYKETALQGKVTFSTVDTCRLNLQSSTSCTHQRRCTGV